MLPSPESLEHRPTGKTAISETEQQKSGCYRMGFRCINCGFHVDMLLVQYSPGNIRLMKCGSCKAIVDEYVECEIMILLIDLILHKRKAYRHLLYNVPDQYSVNAEGVFWRLTSVFLLFDILRNLILYNSKETTGSFASSLSSFWVCGKIFVEVLLGNLVFFYFIFLASMLLRDSSCQVTRYKKVFLAVLVSSYFKIFLIAMMVWEFPSSVLFIIDIFVISSNSVALKVLTQSTMRRCVGVCLGAYTTKLVTNHVFRGRFWHSDC